ncbi:hypothetical protein BP5796_01597 [Coleophoma crateriformis]|uniref:ASST-domain-containing protein n=1 Tax=Coleophoma crateriformis TaxID=565419 RepID=A0A3D8T0W3_9HELO|nr:hypothetical protein BP5796_01597 [Coleophoma crateriformis]
MAPWTGPHQYAPYIYDNTGVSTTEPEGERSERGLTAQDLVWSGYSTAFGHVVTWDFKVVQLNATAQGLAFFRGSMERGHGSGQIILLDDSYKLHRTISAGMEGASVDAHDFHLLENGRVAIVTLYTAVQRDLSSKGFTAGLGWLYDCGFKEYDLETGKVLFEWSSLDHVPIDESAVEINLSQGFGSSTLNPWDYFHINSVEKYKNGDYLISSRHTDTIYRISHKDSSIVWRLGGSHSDFELENFTFSAQHDARVLKESNGKEHISIFNNGWNGETQTRDDSVAMVLELDIQAKKASVLKEWSPLTGGLARHEGSIRFLENGNALVSWGGLAQFSEFAPDGERVLDVRFERLKVVTYRTIKQAWVGRPATLPDVYLYSRSEVDPTYFYMSWNGATEVVSWKVYGLERNSSTAAELLGSIQRQGFETQYIAEQTIASGYIEAVDKHGKVLATSLVKTTTIPPENLRPQCEIWHCSAQADNKAPEAEFNEGQKPPQFMNVKEPVPQVKKEVPKCQMDRRYLSIIAGVVLLSIGFHAGRMSRRLKWLFPEFLVRLMGSCKEGTGDVCSGSKV